MNRSGKVVTREQLIRSVASSSALSNGMTVEENEKMLKQVDKGAKPEDWLSGHSVCKFRNGPMDGEEREISNMCHSAQFDKVISKIGPYEIAYEVAVYMRSCADNTLFLFSHWEKLGNMV